jgi:hypothetical protein
MNPSPQTTRAPKWVLLPLAASLLFAVGIFLMVRENRKLESEIDEIKEQLVHSRQDRAQAEGMLEALRSPEALRVTLSPSAAPDAQPRLDAVYSPRSGRLVVIAANLAPVADDKTYQLWLLPQKGEAIAAGTFRPDSFGHAVYTLALPEAVAPSGFSVTIEPKQGSSTPSGSTVLKGKVG